LKPAAPAPLPLSPAFAEPGIHNKAKVAVLGASGYSGQEFVRLARTHPAIEITALVSRDGEAAAGPDFLPGVDPRAVELPPVVKPEALGSLLEGGACDTIVSALPHGAWAQIETGLSPLLGEYGPRIIDLSADHRDGSDGYVYGLPEAFRDEIRSASRIANPGCYPTAAALALLPAAERDWISGPIMVTAISGASGAGRAPAQRTSFVELSGGAAFYKVGTVHNHVSEMKRTLGVLAGVPIPVAFAPQLVPMSRGILLTATAPLASAVSPEEVRLVFEERYASEPFVRLLPEGSWPETRLVSGSNRCDLSVTTVHGGRHLLVCAAIDNLVKGAAGQAVQNLNIMLGVPETTGLPRNGSPW
jgi:N-acetyl-gamma-glutamyl-phosphate reductase